MRIRRLSLPHFKNLREFVIEFEPSVATTLIVGRNAMGKSNLMEAVVWIFRDLDRGFKAEYRTPFPFVIDYEIRGHDIRIAHNPSVAGKPTTFEVDGKFVPVSTFLNRRERRYLPETLFAYYSGPSNRLEQLFDESLANFRDAMIRNEQNVRQRLIYGRLIHSKFVLLSFFSEDADDTAKFLKEHLGIEELESVLFSIKQPYWGKKAGVKAKQTFWGAQGVVRRFLEHLKMEAVAPLQLDVRVPSGIKRSRSEERVFLFLPDRDAFGSLVAAIAGEGDQGSARELFKTLESAYVSDLIDDVRINVRKRNVDDTVTFRELSEGEQQLLMVLGLLRFTRDEESLFLLDEPDTHLNPAWSQRYLELLEETVSENKSSQVLFATHDPVAISMLKKDQVRLLVPRPDSGLITVEIPEEDPINQGVAGVLTSELFGLRSLYSPVIVELFEERHRLLSLESLTSADQAQLDEVNRRLQNIDLTAATPDPMYANFLRAMAKLDREEISKKPILSPGEVKEQRDLTESVVREMVEEGDESR